MLCWCFQRFMSVCIRIRFFFWCHKHSLLRYVWICALKVLTSINVAENIIFASKIWAKWKEHYYYYCCCAANTHTHTLFNIFHTTLNICCQQQTSHSSTLLCAPYPFWVWISIHFVPYKCVHLMHTIVGEKLWNV